VVGGGSLATSRGRIPHGPPVTFKTWVDRDPGIHKLDGSGLREPSADRLRPSPLVRLSETRGRWQ
jgi:hypothetical protein